MLAREPTWSGLTPGLPVESPLPSADAVALLDDVGLDGTLTALDFGGGRLGMYRLRAEHGDFFLKILPPEMAPTARRAEEVGAWLAARNAPVCACVEGFPRLLPDGRLAVLQFFQTGTRLRPKQQECLALGTALARLHHALHDHPQRETWRTATDQRLLALNEMRAGLVRGTLPAGPDPSALSAVAAASKTPFLFVSIARRPLHGDLNPGNILLVRGAPVFLDFEDVEHSVLNSIFELVLVIERCILVPPGLAAAQRIAAGRALLNGYRQAGGEVRLPDAVRPAEIARCLAFRSLCVLCLSEQNGMRVSEPEWLKFFRLHAFATQCEALWEQIFDAA